MEHIHIIWQQALTPITLWVLYPVGGIIGALILVYVLRNIVWAVRYPFFFLNWLQWLLYSPFRDSWIDPIQKTTFYGFSILLYSGLAQLYWFIMHIAITPIRIINAVYFNIILYWSVIFCDSIAELFHPRLKPKNTKHHSYLFRWVIYFPNRLLNVFKRNGLALLEGVLMTGVDIVLPTYTMFHGTSFKGIATNIAQAGRWYVGSGDYAGSGIYFGLYQKTADHYAKGADHALIVARVTLFPCRNSATLPHRIRSKIGNDGSGISSSLPFPWKSIEHWRNHSYAKWFEYCLVQPGMAGKYVRTWRARPIFVLKHHFPKRIWGGLSLWTGGAGSVSIILFSWLVIIAMVMIYYKYLIFLP
jgi:hypothetical protein